MIRVSSKGRIVALLIINLVLAIGLLHLYENWHEIYEPNASNQHLEILPSGYITDTTIIQYNARGIQNSQIISEQALLFNNSEYYQLTRPDMTLLKAQDRPWSVISEHAIFSPPSGIIKLNENVLLWQAPDPTDIGSNDKFRTIASQQLTVNTTQNLVTSAALVTMTLPTGNNQTNQISAVGMELDLDSKRVKLHNQTKGLFGGNVSTPYKLR